MMKKWLYPLAGILAAAVAAAELPFFDEFTDPAASARNYFSGRAGTVSTTDAGRVRFAEGYVEVENHTLFFDNPKLKNVEISFEMTMVSQRVQDGREQGMIGAIVFRRRLPHAAPVDGDRWFRLIARSGKHFPRYDVNQVITETVNGMAQSRMPVFERNRPYRVRLVCRDRVAIFVDGVEIGASKPGLAINPEGSFAFWVVNATGRFSNLMIHPVEEE